jgi:collagen triple helix repeat protein
MTRGFLRFLRRNTIAMLALFLALGGTTYAASTALIGKNTVASPQVVNGSLKTKDLSAAARRALKGNRGLRGLTGAQGAKGATGAQGVQGVQGTPGAPGSALAYAEVNGAGTLVPGRFKNITQSNVTASGGVFCFSGLSFTPSSVQAIRQGGSGDPGVANYIMGVGGTCPAGTQVTVTIRLWNGADFVASGNNVMVVFN